jgi:hypothetical protein
MEIEKTKDMNIGIKNLYPDAVIFKCLPEEFGCFVSFSYHCGSNRIIKNRKA